MATHIFQPCHLSWSHHGYTLQVFCCSTISLELKPSWLHMMFNHLTWVEAIMVHRPISSISFELKPSWLHTWSILFNMSFEFKPSWLHIRFKPSWLYLILDLVELMHLHPNYSTEALWLHLMWQSPQRDRRKPCFKATVILPAIMATLKANNAFFCICGTSSWYTFLVCWWLCSPEFLSCQSAEPSGYIHLLDMSLVLFVSWFCRCHSYKHVTLQCSLELELDCCHNIDWVQTIPLDGLSAFRWIRFEVCLSVLHLWFTACLCYSVFQPQEKARLDLPVMLEMYAFHATWNSTVTWLLQHT